MYTKCVDYLTCLFLLTTLCVNIDRNETPSSEGLIQVDPLLCYMLTTLINSSNIHMHASINGLYRSFEGMLPKCSASFVQSLSGLITSTKFQLQQVYRIDDYDDSGPS